MLSLNTVYIWMKLPNSDKFCRGKKIWKKISRETDESFQQKIAMFNDFMGKFFRDHSPPNGPKMLPHNSGLHPQGIIVRPWKGTETQ